MKAAEIRQKYLDYFASSPRNHKIISPSPLVLENDSTTLFTSSGMQPLVPYLMGEKHPEGVRLANSQPSLRLQDIEEVGDNRHTTFFEMLGNWSLGNYFKSEQLPWIWEFLTHEPSLPKERLWVSVFEGSKNIPKDEQSYEIWKKLGLPSEKIRFYGSSKNWWSRSGSPDQMPAGEIGGPDSEIFFEFPQVKHNPKFGKVCHPNCDCGRFLEIGNSVFIEYEKQKDGSLKSLPQKNVDFGGGLERLVAATQDEPDVFYTDCFKPLLDIISGLSDAYLNYPSDQQVIADHMKAAVFLAASGVVPSNKQQGYVLRRLIRRAMIKMRKILVPEPFVFAYEYPVARDSIYENYVDVVFQMYQGVYFKDSDPEQVTSVIESEAKKFATTLEKGMKLVGKLSPFDLFQSYGFPLEITKELLEKQGITVDMTSYYKYFAKHQEKSRSSAGKFKGGLADHSGQTTALHTVTHLLHASLRKVLGEHVAQKGSNITAERLRFDFTHSEELTEEQVYEIEKLINEQIDKNLKVSFEEMSLQQALKCGALAFFTDRYDQKVKVYSIGNFSKEVCGGPHVANLSQIGGHVKIIKQDSVGSGARRIYATIEKS